MSLAVIWIHLLIPETSWCVEIYMSEEEHGINYLECLQWRTEDRAKGRIVILWVICTHGTFGRI